MTGVPEPASRVAELTGVTREQFEAEILPAGRPVLMRGLVADWPVAAAGSASPQTLSAYLRGFDRGRPVGAMLGPPSIAGRFFYNADLSGLNFRIEHVPLASALDTMLSSLDDPRPSAIAVQSVPVWANLTGFDAENRLALLPETVEPRVWIGNKVTVAAHHDPSENIACVVAGRRRFTLFPPEQVANLYPGPFERTPAGPVITMVDFDSPDLERYPRFPDAMAAAQVAEMAPGDALYIPYLWWHHVQSLDAINMLVNYWWMPPSGAVGDPVKAMLHAMLAVGRLPEAHRAAWHALFDHYVFEKQGPPGAHLPEAARGALGEMSPDIVRRLRAAITRSLNE